MEYGYLHYTDFINDSFFKSIFQQKHYVCINIPESVFLLQWCYIIFRLWKCENHYLWTITPEFWNHIAPSNKEIPISNGIYIFRNNVLENQIFGQTEALQVVRCCLSRRSGGCEGSLRHRYVPWASGMD